MEKMRCLLDHSTSSFNMFAIPCSLTIGYATGCIVDQLQPVFQRFISCAQMKQPATGPIKTDIQLQLWSGSKKLRSSPVAGLFPVRQLDFQTLRAGMYFSPSLNQRHSHPLTHTCSSTRTPHTHSESHPHMHAKDYSSSNAHTNRPLARTQSHPHT
jgi:hypothetical protein